MAISLFYQLAMNSYKSRGGQPRESSALMQTLVLYTIGPSSPIPLHPSRTNPPPLQRP